MLIPCQRKWPKDQILEFISKLKLFPGLASLRYIFLSSNSRKNRIWNWSQCETRWSGHDDLSYTKPAVGGQECYKEMRCGKLKRHNVYFSIKQREIALKYLHVRMSDYN